MRRALVLAMKDLRMLARSRWIVLLVAGYPLLVAVLVGSVLLNQGPPRVALVNEDVNGRDVVIGDQHISVARYIHRAERRGVDVVVLDRKQALRALDEGQVAGVLVVRRGTMAQLATQLSGVEVEFHTGDSPLGDVVAQRVRGVIYDINLSISQALIEENRSYLDSLVTGGEVVVSGRTYDLYGLEAVRTDLVEARDTLEEQDADPVLVGRVERAIEFAGDAGSAIGLADNALEATAAPIRLERHRAPGKSPLLTAQAVSFGLAVIVTFVSVVMGASLLAGERDDAVLGRMLRGLVTPVEVVVGKLFVGAVLGAVLSLAVFALCAVLAPQAWVRLPVLLGAVLITSMAATAIGTFVAVLARDGRTATLVAMLLVLPFIPLALVGGGGGAVDLVQQVSPMAPARTLFNEILFAESPWRAAARASLHLVVIGAIPAALSMRLLRRLA